MALKWEHAVHPRTMIKVGFQAQMTFVYLRPEDMTVANIPPILGLKTPNERTLGMGHMTVSRTISWPFSLAKSRHAPPVYRSHLPCSPHHLVAVEDGREVGG